MGLTFAVLAFLLTGAHAGWSVTHSGEFSVLVKGGTTMMYEATEESACFLTGMFSTYKHSYDCNIIQAKVTGLQGSYWTLQASGYSSDQTCYAHCMKWSDSSIEASDAIDATQAALDATGLGHALTSEYQQLEAGIQPLLNWSRDSICFLTGMYSSAKHSYVCRVYEADGKWNLKAEGTSTAQKCYARCLSGLRYVDKTTVSGVTEEYSVTKGYTYMSNTANNAACALTGMHSAYDKGYDCRITQKSTTSGLYWYLESFGSAGVQSCSARCLPFLTWTVPEGSWKKLESVGYGSYSQAKAYGVKSTDTTAMSVTWGVSVTAKIQAGFSFASIDATVNASLSVARSSSHSLTHDQTSTFTVKCDNQGNYLTVFQWIATLEHPENDAKTTVANNDFFCLHGGTGNWKPQCPLGFCADTSCQTCAHGWKA